MDRIPKDDRKLSEVKAVLERLQKISAEPGPAGSEPGTAPEDTSRRARRITLAALGLATVVLVMGGLALPDFNRLIASSASRLRPPVTPPEPSGAVKSEVASKAMSTPDSDPPVKQTAATSVPRPALEAALGLLNAGQVQAARKQLLGLFSEDAADVAWALARSYDPNFLRAIQGVDAPPDVAEAARWYRAWHAAAMKHGLVTHAGSLERIIDSMR